MTITFKTNNIIANCTNVVWLLFNLCFKVLNSFYTIITFATISLLQISFCVDYKLMLTLTLDSIEKIFVWNSFFVSTLFYLGNWEILEIYELQKFRLLLLCWLLHIFVFLFCLRFKLF